MAEMFDDVFGPLPRRESIITGIDAEGLAQAILSADAVLSTRQISPIPWGTGVGYRYDTGAGRVKLDLGVFKDQQSAVETFADCWARHAVPPPLRTGVGDMACASDRSLGLIVNNALIWVYWPDASGAGDLLRIGQSIAAELDTGEDFVTRGASVELPEVSVQLPASVGLGQRATGRILVAHADPARVLLGVDDSRNVVVRSGPEPSITFYAPWVAEEAGHHTFTLSVATPENVIVTKQIRILVEAE